MVPRLAGLLLVAALAGCGAGKQGEPEPVTAASGGTAVSADAAQTALRAATTRLAGKTGRFKQLITVSSGSAPVIETLAGTFDGAAQLWDAEFVARQGSNQLGALQFIGSAQALYLTSPTWPQDMRGRWYRITPTEVNGAIGALAQGQRATGVPDAVFAVTVARAEAGKRLPAGTTLDAKLPAEEAIGLAMLRSGLQKLKVDPASLSGAVRVRILLGDSGEVQQLTMAKGALSGIAAQLPADVRSVAGEISVSVQFSDLGGPVDISVPTADQLLPSPGSP